MNIEHVLKMETDLHTEYPPTFSTMRNVSVRLIKIQPHLDMTEKTLSFLNYPTSEYIIYMG